LGILGLFELRRRRRVTGVALAAAAGAVLVVGFSLVSGADWWAAFRTAARIESPDGFMALSNPTGYLLTRVEDIAEIVFFMGPAALWVMARGRREWRADGA